MFQFDIYMTLIIIGVLTISAFWCVILWKTIRIALDNRKAKIGQAVAEPDQEPILLRTNRSWIAFSPILSCFAVIQLIIGQIVLLFFRQGFGGLQAAAFALYSGIFVILQWLYFEITTLSVTKSRVILRSGLFVENKTIIPISEITQIEIVPPTNWLYSNFNEGTIRIVADTKTKTEISLRAIPNPEEIKDFIKQQKQKI